MTDLYLPRRLQWHIDVDKERYKELRQMADASGGFDYSNVRVQTSPRQGAGYEDKIIRAQLLLDEIKDLTLQQEKAALQIMKVSNRLELRYRAPLNLWHVHLLSNKQIAEVLGISTRTVVRRLKTARRLFREADREKSI